jgi:hypothetical protein
VTTFCCSFCVWRLVRIFGWFAIAFRIIAIAIRVARVIFRTIAIARVIAIRVARVTSV